MDLILCDACGKAIKSCGNSFRYLKHIDAILENRLDIYVDSDNNAVSHVEYAYVLCNGCYNRVLIEAVKKFKELRKENQFDLKMDRLITDMSADSKDFRNVRKCPICGSANTVLSIKSTSDGWHTASLICDDCEVNIEFGVFGSGLSVEDVLESCKNWRFGGES